MNASSVCLSESPALRRRGPERQFRFIREPQLRHTSRGKRAGFLALTLALLTATHGLCSTNVTFAPGAYIIDMGVVPQTAANGLKPYGLIYSLVTSNTASVYWAINPNKVTDKNPTVTVEGVDFSLNGKSYRGGPFIIAAEDINPTITGLITTWRANGLDDFERVHHGQVKVEQQIIGEGILMSINVSAFAFEVPDDLLAVVDGVQNIIQTRHAQRLAEQRSIVFAVVREQNIEAHVVSALRHGADSWDGRLQQLAELRDILL